MDSITSALPLDATKAQSAAQPKSRVSESQNQFLQLLVAQLKGQNPMSPMEGSEFVAQLAQFSSLEELTKIRSSMDTVQQVLTESAAQARQAHETQKSTEN